MIILSMPKVRSIEIQRLITIRKQIPSIARKILVHSCLRNDILSICHHNFFILAVSNSSNFPQHIVIKCWRLKEVMKAIDPFIT